MRMISQVRLTGNLARLDLARLDLARLDCSKAGLSIVFATESIDLTDRSRNVGLIPIQKEEHNDDVLKRSRGFGIR